MRQESYPLDVPEEANGDGNTFTAAGNFTDKWVEIDGTFGTETATVYAKGTGATTWKECGTVNEPAMVEIPFLCNDVKVTIAGYTGSGTQVTATFLGIQVRS